MAAPQASDYNNFTTDISPPYVPPNILPVPFTNGVRRVPKAHSQAPETPVLGTTHPTLAQPQPSLSNGGSQF